MVKLTDGNKTIELTKDEMEIIEEALTEVRNEYSSSFSWEGTINNILSKLEGLNYE